MSCMIFCLAMSMPHTVMVSYYVVMSITTQSAVMITTKSAVVHGIRFETQHAGNHFFLPRFGFADFTTFGFFVFFGSSAAFIDCLNVSRSSPALPAWSSIAACVSAA